MKQYDTILFDLDRTLIDSTLANQQSFERAFQEVMGKSCREMIGDMASQKLFACLPALSTSKFYEQLQSVMNLTPEKLKKIDECWDIYYDLADIPLFDGVIELLEQLKKEKWLGIITSRETNELKDPAIQTISRYCVGPIITADMVKKPKPDPEGILLYMSIHGLDPSKTIYIGDAKSDEQAAHAASIDFGYASWDVKEQQPPLNCDLSFDTIEDVKQLVLKK